MLQQVKNGWVALLDTPLYKDVLLIEPDLEERRDLVALPCSVAWETPDHSRKHLPVDTKVIDVFDRMGAGRKLLIVGESGSGKTTALLQLASVLIDRIETAIKKGEDTEQPIPVVFNLSSWVRKRRPLANWIVQELKSTLDERVAKALVEEQKLLLLLDGLDEIRTKYQKSCIESLHKFIHQYRQTEIVICSRIKDYEVLINHPDERLSFQNAVELKPLSRKKINDCLDRAGSEVAAVKTWLQEDDTLYELANTSLMLNLIIRTYRDKGMPVAELPKMYSIEERRRYLFNCYIKQMFFRRRQARQPASRRRFDLVQFLKIVLVGRQFNQRGSNHPYQQEKAKKWLIWLAQTMQQQEDQSIFFIERMQPSLLKPGFQKRIYNIGVGLISALIAWLILCIPAMLVNQQSDLFNGLLLGAFVGILRVLNKKIEPFERLEFSWKNIWKVLQSSFHQVKVFLMIIIISFALTILIAGQTIKFPELILILPVISIVMILPVISIAMIPVLGVGLRGSDIHDDERKIANLGIWQSIRNTIRLFFISGLFYSPFIFICWLMSINWGISGTINGLAITLILGLYVGL